MWMQRHQPSRFSQSCHETVLFVDWNVKNLYVPTIPNKYAYLFLMLHKPSFTLPFPLSSQSLDHWSTCELRSFWPFSGIYMKHTELDGDMICVTHMMHMGSPEHEEATTFLLLPRPSLVSGVTTPYSCRQYRLLISRHYPLLDIEEETLPRWMW